RSFRRAGISIVHSQGFHPKMILSFLPALPLGMEGKEEMLEFKSYYFFNKKKFLKRINKYLPSGLEFIDLEKIKKSKFTLNKNIKTFVYSLDLNNEEVKKAIGSVLGKEKLFSPDYFEILDKRIEEYLVQKKEEVIEKIYIERKINKLFIHINFYQQKQIRPHEIVKDLLPIDNPVFSMAREKTFMNELN
ncbi:MAG: TIGR03936 family radical SAM-associated protein, partial [Candidatus Aminicenantaceae bacterium]